MNLTNEYSEMDNTQELAFDETEDAIMMDGSEAAFFDVDQDVPGMEASLQADGDDEHTAQILGKRQRSDTMVQPRTDDGTTQIFWDTVL